MTKTQLQCLLVNHENNSQFFSTSDGKRTLFFFSFIHQTSTNVPLVLQALIPSKTLKTDNQWILNSAKTAPKILQKCLRDLMRRNVR